MKKIIGFLLVLIIAVSTLCACGKLSEKEQKYVGVWVNFAAGETLGNTLALKENRKFYISTNSPVGQITDEGKWRIKDNKIILDYGVKGESEVEIIGDDSLRGGNITYSISNLDPNDF